MGQECEDAAVLAGPTAAFVNVNKGPAVTLAVSLSLSPPSSIDVTEVQIFIIIMYLLAAVGGAAFWQSLVSVALTKRARVCVCLAFAHRVLPVSLSPDPRLKRPGEDGSCRLHLFRRRLLLHQLLQSHLHGRRRQKRLHHRSKFCPPARVVAAPAVRLDCNLLSRLCPQGTSVLSPVLHIGSVIILAVMIYKKSAVQLFERHPCLYILAFGFISAKITNKLVVSVARCRTLSPCDAAAAACWQTCVRVARPGRGTGARALPVSDPVPASLERRPAASASAG